MKAPLCGFRFLALALILSSVGCARILSKPRELGALERPSAPASTIEPTRDDEKHLFDLIWGNVPPGFRFTDLQTQWSWIERDSSGRGLKPKFTLDLNFELPFGWRLKQSTPLSTKLVVLKKLKSDRASLWSVKLEQESKLGQIAFQFLDENDELHELTLNVKPHRPEPLLLVKEVCPNFEISISPRINYGQNFYLGYSCREIDDEVVLYFVKSPDARWVPSKQIKSSEQTSFEVRLDPNDFDVSEPSRRLFDIVTLDDQGRRVEYDVFRNPKHVK